MIWGVFILLVAALSYWLAAPWSAAQRAKADFELDEARAQLKQLELDVEAGRISAEMAAESRTALERRVLTLLDAPATDVADGNEKRSIVWALPALIGLGGLAVYLAVGAPNLVPQTEMQREVEARQAFERDVAQLAAQLDADPEAGFEGHLLLARGYMGLDRFDEALASYQIALEKSGNAPIIQDEIEGARAYIQRQTSGPDPQAAAAIQALPQAEQEAMIFAMVEGLAVRLENEPLDPEGWIRLIRSRLVLNQADQARSDVATARQYLSETPNLLAQLESGLAPLAGDLAPSQADSPAQDSSTP